MATPAARDSCDLTYHDAHSSAGGDDTVSEQGSSSHEGSASETPRPANIQSSEWLSELIGKLAVIYHIGAHRLELQALAAHRSAMGEGI